jgi:hypothetical protein
MLRSVFYAATYWLPALLILLIVLARMAAPFPYGGADYNQTIEESLVVAARQRSDSGDLYVKVDGADPSDEVLAELNSRKLPATFAPWSLRQHDQCPQNGRCDSPVHRTETRDNFLSADLLSMPLWSVALVRVKSRACTSEVSLIHATRWRVMSQRTACTEERSGMF